MLKGAKPDGKDAKTHAKQISKRKQRMKEHKY